MDFPQSQEQNRVTITPAGFKESIGGALFASGSAAFASAVYNTANRAAFVPFLVQSPMLAVKLVSYNGTVASGNIDVGIYDDQFNRIVSSGSTAQSGTSTLQEFDITDTLLLPGVYYMAVAMDNTTGTLFRMNPVASAAICAGVLTQTSAFPLPDPATPTTAVAYVPGIGVTTRSVV